MSLFCENKEQIRRSSSINIDIKNSFLALVLYFVVIITKIKVPCYYEIQEFASVSYNRGRNLLRIWNRFALHKSLLNFISGYHFNLLLKPIVYLFSLLCLMSAIIVAREQHRLTVKAFLLPKHEYHLGTFLLIPPPHEKFLIERERIRVRVS